MPTPLFFLFPKRRGFLFGQGWPGTDWLLCGCTKVLCGRCPQEGLCRARVQVCGELVNEFFLTSAGQQLLMHQGKPPGSSSAVWSELGVCVGGDVGQNLVQEAV